MDQETIQNIVAEVVRLLPSDPRGMFVVQVVLTLIAAAAGAFLGGHFRGKHLATKADLEGLKAQFHTKAETVEQRRKSSNLRHAELKALLNKLHDCEAYRERLRTSAAVGQPPNERDPVSELRSIAVLYFPEMETEVAAYAASHNQLVMAALTMASEIASCGTDLIARKQAVDKYNASAATLLAEIHDAVSLIHHDVRRALAKVLDVPSTG